MILLLACATGADPSTRLDDVQVLTILAEPPELRAGETAALDTLIVNPLERDLEVMQWTCTPSEDGCTEAADGWPNRVRTTEARFEDEVTVSPFLADALSDEPIPLVQVWTLACEADLCPVFDDDGASLDDALTNPRELLKTLPIEGVSLASRWVWASSRDDVAPNPTVSCVEGERDTVEGVEQVAFTCDVEGAWSSGAAVWGYATAGGWGPQAVELAEGDTQVEYTWFPDGEADLYVVVTDGAGGVGLWER